MLAALWGEHHSRLFLDYGLPSLLAADNLPLLARQFDCDFEFLTLTEDIRRFRDSPAIAALSAHARVHFTSIDDLKFNQAYGIVLTLAFARGIAGRRDEMTETTFVFLNADFVFSNGSLRSMCEALREGYNAVMAPSFRCASEAFIEQFRGKLGMPRGTAPVLSLSSRELVSIAIELVHPTFEAKTVNSGGPFTTLVNQFLWQVDTNTLLGRFYLLFMLCIRPEVPLDEVIGFCDYTLVPQLVPSGKVKILTDSDEAFLLELQNSAHEVGENLVDEMPEPAFLAERLSEWTTPLHRQFALQDLIFHAEDLPEALDRTRVQAKAFIEDIASRLGPPCPYRDHRYWKSTFIALKADPDGVPVFRSGAVAAGTGEEEGAGLPLDGRAFLVANLRRIRDRLGVRIHDLRAELNEKDAALTRLLAGRAARFDAAYYRRTTPEFAHSGLDPETHYRTLGWKRGRDTSPYFIVTCYLAENPDVKTAVIEPLEHFCRHGRQEGRTGWRKLDFEEEFSDATSNYAANVRPRLGIRRRLSSVFQRQRERGANERDLVRKSGLFDASYYLATNSDVAASGGDPLDHYMTKGAREGRRPSRTFDARRYLDDNPDVRAAGLNPIVHWLLHGQYEDRPSPLVVGGEATQN